MKASKNFKFIATYFWDKLTPKKVGNCIIEVVTSSVHSSVEAERGGAKRIELCGALATAGITPSPGLFLTVKKNVSIPIYVMIRPREGNFCYSDQEFEVMMEEINYFKSVGADGFVFGVLHEDATIDIRRTKLLVDACGDLPATFHRAIDITPNMFDALEEIISTGCKRILTSGGAPTGPQGVENISKLVKQASDRIIIMPGGGIRPDTFQSMLNPDINEYHLSGRLPVVSSFQSSIFDMNWAETDAGEIRKVVTLLED